MYNKIIVHLWGLWKYHQRGKYLLIFLKQNLNFLQIRQYNMQFSNVFKRLFLSPSVLIQCAFLLTWFFSTNLSLSSSFTPNLITHSRMFHKLITTFDKSIYVILVENQFWVLSIGIEKHIINNCYQVFVRYKNIAFYP